MGFFNKTKEEKRYSKEKNCLFIGKSMQAIGNIPQGTSLILGLNPDEKNFEIRYGEKKVTIPYKRLRGFKVEEISKLNNSGSGIGGALIGGALFGGVGAIVGQNAQKGKVKKKWIGTLTFIDKNSNDSELQFVQQDFSGEYSGDNKLWGVQKFEDIVNLISAENNEEITEL